MKQTFHVISATLLLILLLFKVANLHVYSHTDEAEEDAIEHCTGCELAIESQQNSAILNHSAAASPSIDFAEVTQNHNFSVEPVIFELDYTIYSRPPPVVG